MTIQTVSTNTSYGGVQGVYRHASQATGTDMVFSVYVPPHAAGAKLPVVWYLSGLTCTHANVTEKGEFRKACAELGLIFVAPDTSPRGPDVPGDANNAYDFGLGAGFYVDATQAAVCAQLSHVELCHRRAAQARGGEFSGRRQAAIGDGPFDGRPWRADGRAAQSAPLSRRQRIRADRGALAGALGHQGADRLSRTEQGAWRNHDTVALIEDGAKYSGFLVDVGEADNFLKEQLKPELLQAACTKAGIPLTLRRQPGYDHSYYFISTFMSDHLHWHAERLKG